VARSLAHPPFGVREADAVRRCVIGVTGGEVPPGEECVACGRVGQAPHVVERKGVGPCGVGHLGQPRVVIVRVIHRGTIRIELLRQPVQLVVSVGDQLVLTVCFSGQVPHRVVAVGSSTTWRTRPEILRYSDRTEYPSGYYNLGVAHGVPGIVHFLYQVTKTGIEPSKTSSLLNRTLAWLVSQADSSGSPLRFKAWVTTEGKSRNARPVWCYGDLGIAAVLLQIAEGSSNTSVNGLACRMLDTCLELPIEYYHVEDAGLCHGATGVAHIYNRTYQVRGDPRYREAALDWYGRALAMFKRGTGVGGYSKCVMPEPNGTSVWEPWPGFLDGSIGVALALLAAVTPVEPRWDRALLLSSPLV